MGNISEYRENYGYRQYKTYRMRRFQWGVVFDNPSGIQQGDHLIDRQHREHKNQERIHPESGSNIAVE